MKISILTPSYNSGKYIERAIQSALQQDYDNWEHIIVDGGSTDGTLEILKKYPHLKWISEPDKGQSDAMNKAFKMSSGDIIGYLNADDYYFMNLFSHVIDQFSKNPSYDLLVGDLQINYMEANTVKRSIQIRPDIEYKKILYPYKFRFPVNPVCYFYKRQVQTGYIGFPLNNHFTMDYHFLLYAFQKYSVSRYERLFGAFVMDDNNKTSNLKNVEQVCINEAFRHVYRNNRKILPIFCIRHFYYRYGKNLLKTARYKMGVIRKRLLWIG